MTSPQHGYDGVRACVKPISISFGRGKVINCLTATMWYMYCLTTTHRALKTMMLKFELIYADYIYDSIICHWLMVYHRISHHVYLMVIHLVLASIDSCNLFTHNLLGYNWHRANYWSNASKRMLRHMVKINWSLTATKKTKCIGLEKDPKILM